MASPPTSARITRMASSVLASVIGGLPRTRRAESPRPIPRSIRPPEISSSVASAEAVTVGSRVPGFVTRRPHVADELAARVDEVALAVEVVVADVGLDADPVDRPDVVAVGDRVARLLDPPEVLGQAARGCTRDEDDLGAVEAERPSTFREVAVVADVDTDLADSGLEDRIAEVAGPEVELLP